jgi:Tfp pilus assembly protein FimT
MKNLKAFSFVELLLVIGIITTLIMISTTNLFPLKQKVSISSTIQSLISDIKQQQVKSMNGESAQGIYFSADQKKYVLFQGTTYNISNTTNFSIDLGDQILVNSIDFSNRQIIFTPGSGEITGFLPANNKIILKNTVSGETKTIIFNKFGVITNVE